MSSNALFVHVPVDMVEIVNGPDAVYCAKLRDKLSQLRHEEYVDLQFHGKNLYRYVDVKFRMKTPASEETFERKLHLAEVFGFEGDSFSFTALFNGKIVSGPYDMRMQTGWFNLD